MNKNSREFVKNSYIKFGLLKTWIKLNLKFKNQNLKITNGIDYTKKFSIRAFGTYLIESMKLGLKLHPEFIFIFLIACQSKQVLEKPAAAERVFQYSTKAYIKNVREKKDHNVSVDIILAGQQHLRMEVTAILGYPVATVVITPQEIRTAIYSQKKFYIAKNEENGLRSMLNFPIEPKNLIQLILDLPLKGWSCDMGKEGMLARCSQKGELLVAWSDRREDQKKVVIRSPQFEMDWLFLDKKELPGYPTGTFQLPVPNGYSVQSLVKR